METKYGGHTVAELREYIAHSNDNEESIDSITGDDATSANVIRDLLDALEGAAIIATQAGSEIKALRARVAALPSDAAQAPIYQGRTKGEQQWLDLSQDAFDHMAAKPSIFETGVVYAAPQPPVAASFQARVQPWLLECFGPMIASDREERNHRFFEEATELVQACGMTASEAHQLVDYTFGRPVGEPMQEVGGVMVTLAALCLANGLDMHAAGETELARISVPETVAKIRAKQAAKPKHSPLPAAAPQPPVADAARGEPETDK